MSGDRPSEDFPGDDLDLKGMTIADPEGEFHPGGLNFGSVGSGSGEEYSGSGSGEFGSGGSGFAVRADANIEDDDANFEFTVDDRDKEVAKLLKEFYAGKSNLNNNMCTYVRS